MQHGDDASDKAAQVVLKSGRATQDRVMVGLCSTAPRAGAAGKIYIVPISDMIISDTMHGPMAPWLMHSDTSVIPH